MDYFFLSFFEVAIRNSLEGVPRGAEHLLPNHLSLAQMSDNNLKHFCVCTSQFAIYSVIEMKKDH